MTIREYMAKQDELKKRLERKEIVNSEYNKLWTLNYCAFYRIAGE